jgi:hypothetical protein
VDLACHDRAMCILGKKKNKYISYFQLALSLTPGRAFTGKENGCQVLREKKFLIWGW